MTTRLLLVEDNPGDATLVIDGLSVAPSAALSVVHERTLAAALRRLASASFDAIILDLGLPDSTGLHTVERVKAAAQGTPIIVVSEATQELRGPLLAAGVDEVLSKVEISSWLFSRCVLYVVERARVRSSHRNLEKLLDATPDAIVVVDGTSIVRYVNKAALMLFGLSRDALVGEVLGFVVKDGQPAEIEVPRAAGTRSCEMRVVPLDWEGEPAHLASIRDVTETRLAQGLRERASELELENTRIQELTRLKSEFIANMSHELRTPLNAIIGFAQLMVTGKVPKNAPEHDEFLADILSSGQHLLRLVNDVLDLAKVEAGKLEFFPESIDLPRAICEVVTMLRAVAAEHQVSLDLQLDPALKRAELDPLRLKQVLYNYLSNALKFSPVGGRIVVRTSPETSDAFRIEVQDQGKGIAEADVDRLFVEFQQLESGMSRRYQGTGLGLALTRRIVEGQGGSVGVCSSPGEGSRFFAVLPRCAPAASGLTPSPLPQLVQGRFDDCDENSGCRRQPHQPQVDEVRAGRGRP